MQGFNRYFPPDFDPEKHKTLNSYHGKHALGDRARKIDQGILITRFELPFNIWCGTCNNHIGMGVRYNAEKRKIGSYFSTPMFAFRCKCHLCGGWFEIQTDPKNTRYVVTSGARQKDEEWDPEKVGGFAIHDPSAAGPSDPLQTLEKTTAAALFSSTVQAPRLSELYELSDRLTSDPYAHSVKLRKAFREEKKVEKKLKERDDELKGRYGLPEDLVLLRDGEGEGEGEESEEWRRLRGEWHAEEERKRRMLEAESGFVVAASERRGKARVVGLGAGSGAVVKKGREKEEQKKRTVESLAEKLARNTARRADPFGGGGVGKAGVVLKGIVKR